MFTSKKSVGLIFVSLIFLSLFVGIVAAQGLVGPPAPSSGSALGNVFDKFTSSISNWFNATESFKVQQYILFFLIVLVIYSVCPFLPFVGKSKTISFLISLAIGALSILFLKKEEIAAAIFAYSALGMTLTIIIPFFAIAAISKRLYEGGTFFISKFLWVVFLAVIIARWVSAYEQGTMTLFAEGVQALILVLTIGMILWEQRMYNALIRAAMKGDGAKVGRLATIRHNADLGRDLARLEDMSPGVARDNFVTDLKARYPRSHADIDAALT